MKRTALGLALCFAAAPLSARADVWTDWGNVSEISSGWAQDSMAVTTTAIPPNTGCPVTNVYATDPADPGHDLYHATLMTAFAMNRQVQILLHGCVYQKPRIIAVSIR
jgi:hypothetical protein